MYKANSLILKAATAILPVTLLATGASAADVKVLHNFGGSVQDGQIPFWGALTLDRDGNLYGTTLDGGGREGGTVFELTPEGNGFWKVIILHSFGLGSEGSGPAGGVIFDSSGNLYGTTLHGGVHDRGTVFELSPAGDGKWTHTILHSFNESTHGWEPSGTLIFDSAGNLYGTTMYGGLNGGRGSVFELSPGEDGKWTETVLHSFDGKNDGAYPAAGLVFDAVGNLYGRRRSKGPIIPQEIVVGGLFSN